MPQDSLAFWLLVADHINDGILVKDITTDTLVYANQAAANYVGVPLKKIIGSHSKDFYPDHYEEYYKDDLRIFQTGQARLDYWEKYYDQDGLEHHIITKKLPVQTEGFSGVVALFLDVTEFMRTIELSEDYGESFDKVSIERSRHEARRLIEALYD